MPASLLCASSLLWNSQRNTCLPSQTVLSRWLIAPENCRQVFSLERMVGFLLMYRALINSNAK